MRNLAFILALAPAWPAAQAAATAQSSCANTPVYSPCEIVFEMTEAEAAANPNPYATVDLSVELRSPRMRTSAIPGFWDGGRRVVVRLTPTDAGQWIYRIESNMAGLNGQEGSFTAAPSNSPGFIRPAEVHHWGFTERDLPHLWMGAAEPGFATLDDAEFKAVADARAAQKFNHLRGLVIPAAGGAFSASGAPDPAHFQRLDARVRYLNQKGIIADLTLARDSASLSRLFPNSDFRKRFVRYLVARYAAMNITWQGVDDFESDSGGRAILQELGMALKQSDPYQHPRTSGARVTSAPLLGDGWMDFAAYGPGAASSVSAIEHQLYAVPFVNTGFAREDSGAGKSAAGDLDADAYRRRLWNAVMDGQYPTYANTAAGSRSISAPGVKAMTAYFELFSTARHWEMEPYFDVEGGRALALEDADYIVYVEEPGPVTLTVVKHGYEVRWIDPASGESIKQKKDFSGDHFTGEPPDRSHDWVLRLVRSSRLESLGRQYRFESRSDEEDSPARTIVLQTVETSAERTPYEIAQPAGDISVSKPTPYTANVTRQTRGTRAMMWMWAGEASPGGGGYRVLGASAKGEMHPQGAMARSLPSTLLLRVYAMNANGKVYLLNQICRLVP